MGREEAIMVEHHVHVHVAQLQHNFLYFRRYIHMMSDAINCNFARCAVQQCMSTNEEKQASKRSDASNCT